MDSETLKEAERIADEKCRLPERTPLEATAFAATMAMAAIGAFALLSDWMGGTLAGFVTIGLAGAVAYMDCNQKYRAHSEALTAAIDYLERCKKI